MTGENEWSTDTSGMDYYMRMLLITNSLREPVIRSAIEILNPSPGSRGLDVGCAAGLQMLLLARAVGPGGHVTGLDISPAFLAHGERFAGEAGLAAQVSFRKGDYNALPFDDATFDWVWSADCAGYASKDSLLVIRELARVVKPGGTVAILFWSSQQLLPGYPLIEARLNTTTAGIAPFTQDRKPETHSLRALGWFRQAGLVDSTAHTLVRTVQGPLDDNTRDAMLALLEMRWGSVEPEVSWPDWETYQRLTAPDSTDLILDCPDYYGFFTYSMFRGKVPL